MSSAVADCLSEKAQRPHALHVLQVSAFFPGHGGGIEAVAGALARRLAMSGHRVHWMAGGPPDETPDGADGLQVERASSWDPLERRLGLPAPIWSPSSLIALWRAVGRCQVLHVHDYLYLHSLAAMAFARLRAKPIVLTQHIGDIAFSSPRPRQILRLLNRTVGTWAMRAASQVVFVGQPVLRYFESFACFQRAPMLLPNGVNHAHFFPRLPEVKEHPSTVLHALFVGRFVEKKGLNHLRAAISVPGVRWTFIGAGPLNPEGWTPEEKKDTTLLGRLPADAVAAHYQSADLLVLPSTGEGFPLVVQEALACGTPVLVSTEVLEAFPSADDRCVFEVELRCEDPGRALATRLAALAADPGKVRAARFASAKLAQQWNWESTTAAYAAIYGGLAVSAKAPP